MNFRRALTVTFLLLALSAVAPATPILCNTLGTLQAYIDAGACQLDNIVFSNFTYSGSMTGNPDDAIGPPLNPSQGINGGYITAGQVSVLTDQGGRTGALQFRGIWEILGPDTDPSGGPPPGPIDGSTGPAYETLSITFDAEPVAGHQVTNLFSQNQASTGGDGSVVEEAICVSPCSAAPANFADSLVALDTPVTGAFEIQNNFRFVSNTDTSDAHLSVINDAVLESSTVLMPTPEPGTVFVCLGGLLVLAGQALRQKR